MNAAVAPLIVVLLLLPTLAFAQAQDYQVVKSDRSETFTFPFSAANQDVDSPLVYNYDTPKGPSWILSITNGLDYSSDENSKVIIRIQEPAPSEKYIDIAMYGGEAKKFWVAANLPGTGYARLYSKDVEGWSTESPIAISHADTSGLSITDGKRIILDRFDVSGFTVGSISVYGKDESTSPPNAEGGQLQFDILYGSFQDSPLFLVPGLVTAGIGAVIVTLLVVKKRKPTD
ncbi:MAG TPA: hypothetical protein VJP79_01765 [Nitrososphaera sp.]|nr:hypothetical protein [Nitrososphaera sp.]